MNVKVLPAPSDEMASVTLPVCPQRAEPNFRNQVSRWKLPVGCVPPFLITTVTDACVPGGPLLGETTSDDTVRSEYPTEYLHDASLFDSLSSPTAHCESTMALA